MGWLSLDETQPLRRASRSFVRSPRHGPSLPGACPPHGLQIANRDPRSTSTKEADLHRDPPPSSARRRPHHEATHLRSHSAPRAQLRTRARPPTVFASQCAVASPPGSTAARTSSSFPRPAPPAPFTPSPAPEGGTDQNASGTHRAEGDFTCACSACLARPLIGPCRRAHRGHAFHNEPADRTCRSSADACTSIKTEEMGHGARKTVPSPAARLGSSSTQHPGSAGRLAGGL